MALEKKWLTLKSFVKVLVAVKTFTFRRSLWNSKIGKKGKENHESHMVQSHHRQRALFHHLTSVGRSFCKIKKEKKTQSEVKWANMLLLSAQACTENQPAWPCPCQAKHLYSPEKSETIDKHRSKPEVAPLAIMFPAVRVCALIDSASSSAERDPEGSSLAACFVSCGRPLSARAGTLRTAGGPAQALPLTGGCS